MSPEAILAYSLLASIAGLYVVGRIDAWLQQRKRRREIEADVNAALDARTDRLMRAGIRMPTEEEIAALLERREHRVTPQDFDAQLVERSGRPLRWEKLPEDGDGGRVA